MTAHNGEVIPITTERRYRCECSRRKSESPAGLAHGTEGLVPHWACAAYAPNSVALCEDGANKVVCSTRLELKAARSCTAACAVNSDDNGNGWQVGLLVKCIMH